MTPLRAGVIGGGWIARVHVPAIDAAEGVELVAAADLDIDRASAIAEPRGARAYTRWKEMLEREQLDLLWVCTPPLHHREPVVAALAGGIHVYLEKPIARTMADAEAIVEAARLGPGICAIGYQWHASELLDEVRQTLSGRPAGMLVGRNYGPVASRPWFMNQVQGGGPEQFRIAGRSGDSELACSYGDPMTRSIDRFLEVARSGERSRIFCGPDDALRTLAVALACERALETGGRVAV
jgi:predicted dehydrogenase